MRLLSFILAVLTALTSFGFNRADSVNVYFSVGSRYFDPSLANNREAMNDFINKVKKAAAEDDIENIVVYGYASPEGKPLANERLARNRCYTIADYIAEKTGVNPELIEKRPSGIGWDELRRLVEANPNVPYRQKVLDILENTPIWVYDGSGRIVDGRKKQLMDLAGGRAWDWMYHHLYPELRNAVAISLYCRHIGVVDITDISENPAPAAVSDSIASDSTADTIAIAEPSDSIEASESWADVITSDGGLINLRGSDSAKAGHTPRHLLALKTNLLYYAALLPNVELECLFNDRWSVAVEGNVAWWGSYKNDKSYRLAVIDAEMRYWALTREPWHGMYVGVIGGGGWYDLKKGSKPGKYGDGAMAGLSLGYVWPIGRNLSLEAEIGAGYIYTRYKEYETRDSHHVYMRTKDINYFGPIKAKFSIVWRFLDINKSNLSIPAL